MSQRLLLISSVLILGSAQYQYKYRLLPAPVPVIRTSRNVQVSSRPITPTFRRASGAPSSSNLPVASTYQLQLSPSDQFLRAKAVYYNAASNAGNDIISQTKAQALGLIDILTEFSSDPKAVQFARDNIDGSACIKSLGDAISATKFASDLMERSGSELSSLLNTYEQLKNEKDTVALMRGSAKMLIILDDLIPKLANFPLTTQCRVGPNETLKGMQDLANLVIKMSKNPDFPLESRSYLERSGKIMDASVTFITNTRKIYKKFPEFCSSDADFTDKAIGAVGRLVDEASILVKAVGRDFDLQEIKQKNINYASQLVDTMRKVQSLDIGFISCNTALSWKLTAEAMNEVADIVEEIGIDQLSKQLGIEFNLAFE